MQEEKNILIIDSIIEEEIRIMAIDENDEIKEYRSYHKQKSILGNVYLAQVEYIKESIEAVFVKLDEKIQGFLAFKQIAPEYYKKSNIKEPKLKDLIKHNQKIPVQVIREASQDKLANVTTYITFNGKNCIFSPIARTENGVSRKIKGEYRIRAKEMLANIVQDGSLIIRTAAKQINQKELEDEYKYFAQIWAKIKKQMQGKPKLLYENDDFLKILRNYSIYSIKKAIVTTPKFNKKIKDYCANNLLNYPKIVLEKKCSLLKKVEPQIWRIKKT